MLKNRKFAAFLLSAALVLSACTPSGGNDKDDDKDDDVSYYAELADDYYDIGDYGKAIEVLEEGLEKTESSKLRKKLNKLKSESTVVNETAEASAEAQTDPVSDILDLTADSTIAAAPAAEGDDLLVHRGDEFQMPDIVGMTWEDLLTDHSELNFVPTLQYSSEYPKNVVIYQSVMPHRTVRRGQSIEITVSSGPKLVETDDYSNKPIDDVITLLTKLDLKYEIKRINDSTVAKDHVIGTEPAAHEFVEPGSTVICYVSLGQDKETTSVPQLVDLSLASAQQRANDYNVQLVVEYQPSAEVEEGKVISQSIEPTAVVEENTVITIVVSTGGSNERECSIGMTITGNAHGEFEFRYYIDGTLIENMTTIRDLALSDRFDWTFSNTGVHTYAVIVKSTATNAEDIFFDCTVDFTKDPPEKTFETFSPKVFKQLLDA